MGTVSVRDLRNRGGDVLARVQRGESLTVTSSGDPVARLTPLPRPSASPEELVRRWRNLPPMDLVSLRGDIDAVTDTSL
jgi:prevent-host-death family protein